MVQNLDRQRVPSGPPRTASQCSQRVEKRGPWIPDIFGNMDSGKKVWVPPCRMWPLTHFIDLCCTWKDIKLIWHHQTNYNIVSFAAICAYPWFTFSAFHYYKLLLLLFLFVQFRIHCFLHFFYLFASIIHIFVPLNLFLTVESFVSPPCNQNNLFYCCGCQLLSW